ncbi:probable alpha-glucosidase Os06g0675700 [Triticum dicoccoides]|uniref:probable alpha-glucosidase Os06g0675700 n=1 Tax=Triticum dicoccoides TaxID=85692 RepID=UPI001890B496|nr:probable alpha-glucosidase Os06g0675700 [Triticum dicoccoides]
MMIVSSFADLLALLTILICLLHRCGANYEVESVDGSGNLLSAKLTLVGGTTQFGPDVKQLNLTASLETDNQLHVRITDADHQRWEVPQDVIPRPEPALEDVLLHSSGMSNASLPGSSTMSSESSDLTFTIHTAPFRFTVSRRSTGDVLFDISATLVFKNRYLEVTSALPAKGASLYELGEQTKRTFRLQQNDTFTIWNEDLERSDLLDINLYSSHPFYMDVRPGGAAHGVLLLNTNGMDIKYGGSYITYKVIGGVLDFYFFAGPSPLAVVDQYTQLIGRPAPMPYWSFGFHQCRYGYKNVADLEGVVAGYAKAKIPLESIWSDIDYMDGYQDFTLDPVNYPAKLLRPFVDRLHNSSQKYVVIIDPAIKKEAAPPQNEAVGLFLQRNGTNYVGRVWPGEVYYPDFMNPRTAEYWARKISEFRRTIPADGLWCDMNEPSNFKAWEPLNEYDDSPYRINNTGIHRNLNNKTVPVSAVHFNGVSEYDAHNLYGLLESRATHDALLKDTARRPFVLSRATFVGSGRYTAHWTGDNAARWDELAHSINTILNSGLFGIPMMGADICGFNGNTTQELCSRWIQLGAFYPFARAHAEKTTVRRELYVWEPTAQSARKALGMRYRMLPYIYTLMFEAHTTGAPIARPLFFSYPQDADTYGVDRQFLLGRGVLVSPVLEAGATTVDAYFPAGRWFSLHDHSPAITLQTGKRVTLPAPTDSANVHLAGGNILPLQQPGLTTSATRQSEFHLLVALAENGTARGELFLDDGESPEMGGMGGNWTLVRFSCNTEDSKGIITTTVSSHVVQNSYAPSQTLVIGKVIFMGLPSPPKGFTVYVNGVELKAAGTKSRTNGVFSVSGLSLVIGQQFEIKVVMSH